MDGLLTGVLPAQQLFVRYQGRGEPPAGCGALSRAKERGRYQADERLTSAVRTAIALELPLLVTGEPGTGKTALAWSIASELGLGPVLEFHTRSDHMARDALYTFDHVLRFYDAQTQSARAKDPSSYVTLRALGAAIASPVRRVVLIDEIDKASRDFPNDLLDELDQMEFTVGETSQSYQAAFRPIVVITSNSERQLPDPFLRRCVFHEIQFPPRAVLFQILRERLGDTLPQTFLETAVQRFMHLRDGAALRKPPATAEFVNWVRALLLVGCTAEALLHTSARNLPCLSVLLKSSEDLQQLQRGAPTTLWRASGVAT